MMMMVENTANACSTGVNPKYSCTWCIWQQEAGFKALTGGYGTNLGHKQLAIGLHLGQNSELPAS